MKCHYKTNIAVKIDSGSNPYYIALVVENVNGDGEISAVDILPQNRKSWIPMQRSWGETWKSDLRNDDSGPLSIRVSDRSSKSVVAYNLIPRNWVPGKTYYSKINFP